jgi:polysaccharide biosynthesis transport protein
MSNHAITPHGGAPGELGRPDPDALSYHAGYAEGPPNGYRLLVRRVLSAIWRYKWLSGLIVVGGAAAALTVPRYLVEPTYRASADIWVEREQRGPDWGPIQRGQLLDSSGWLDLVRSFAVLDPVVHQLKLYLTPRDPADKEAGVFASFEALEDLRPGLYRFRVDDDGAGYTLTVSDGEVVERGRRGEPVGAEAGFRWAPPADVFRPGREIQFTLERPRTVAGELATSLDARLQRESNFMRIALEGSDPHRVTDAANHIADQFVVVAADLKRAQVEEQARNLEVQLREAERSLNDARAELQSFRVGTVTLPSDRAIAQAPGLTDTQPTVFGEYFGMKIERDHLRRDRQAVEAAIGEVMRNPLSVTALENIASVRQSSEIMGALGEVTEKRAQLRAMRNQFTEEYPLVQQLIGEIRTLEQQTIPRLAADLTASIAAREREMDARLASAESELSEIPERSIQERSLEHAVGLAQGLHGTVSQRFETARLAAVSSVPDVRVLDHANVPFLPVNAQEGFRLFVMILGASLGLALALPVLLDRLDTRVRYPEQVTYDLGLPILGAVPHVRATNGKKRWTGDGNHHAIEAFREIRLNTSHAFGTAGPLLTTVTSPGPGDGKSFIAMNLAFAFADQGNRVLLIDGDIRRGQIHRLLDVPRVPGLTDFLAKRVGPEEIIRETAYASLDLIPSGTRMEAGPELLGSPLMGPFVRDLRSSYDVILLDSPPFGAGVDPFVLSTLTGAALIVLRNGQSDREFAQAKLELLDRLPVRILGAVLNDVPATGAYKYYSYVSGYDATDELPPAESEEEPPRLQAAGR